MITIIVIMVTIKKREGKEQELRKKILLLCGARASDRREI
jgi:hypothetical protein